MARLPTDARRLVEVIDVPIATLKEALHYRQLSHLEAATCLVAVDHGLPILVCDPVVEAVCAELGLCIHNLGDLR